MKLFFDENIGSTVPDALRHVGAPAQDIARPRKGGVVGLGATDIEWVRHVGANGYLGLTEDLKILQSPAVIQEARRWGAGLIFLPTGQWQRWQVLRLLLWRWEWLQTVDASVSRPFAFRWDRHGRARRIY